MEDASLVLATDVDALVDAFEEAFVEDAVDAPPLPPAFGIVKSRSQPAPSNATESANHRDEAIR